MIDVERLKEAILSPDTPLLGAGIARRVYGISDQVVAKVPRAVESLQQQIEINFHQMYADTEWGRFLPEIYGVIEINDAPVIFMERVEPLGMYIFDYINHHYSDEEKYDMLAYIQDFEDYTRIFDCSDNENNWGINKEGQLVLMDCGMSDEYYEMYDEVYSDADYFSSKSYDVVYREAV